MFVISPQSKCFHCRGEAGGARARARACTPPGNIKSLRKSIWALGAEMGDRQEPLSEGRKSPADVGTER